MDLLIFAMYVAFICIAIIVPGLVVEYMYWRNEELLYKIMKFVFGVGFLGALFYCGLITVDFIRQNERQKIFAQYNVQPKQAIYKTMTRERFKHPDMIGRYPEI